MHQFTHQQQAIDDASIQPSPLTIHPPTMIHHLTINDASIQRANYDTINQLIHKQFINEQLMMLRKFVTKMYTVLNCDCQAKF